MCNVETRPGDEGAPEGEAGQARVEAAGDDLQRAHGGQGSFHWYVGTLRGACAAFTREGDVPRRSGCTRRSWEGNLPRR